MTPEFITLTEMDYNRIHSLIEQQLLNPTPNKEIAILEEEIEQARILDFPEIPTDLVTMNSKVKYQNVTDGKENEITIVYPKSADSSRGLVSVTAPLGMALLGLREEEEIDWAFPDGSVKRLKVLKIIYQPEANGDLRS